MTEQNAIKLGYNFTGGTANIWDEQSMIDIRKNAAKIRKLGFKAYVCTTTKDSWGGGCKMLYAEPAYFQYAQFENIKQRLNNGVYKKQIEYLQNQISECLRVEKSETSDLYEYMKLLEEKGNFKALKSLQEGLLTVKED